METTKRDFDVYKNSNKQDSREDIKVTDTLRKKKSTCHTCIDFYGIISCMHNQ